MDIGDLLNVLLAVIIIIIAIVLALNLPKIAFGTSGQENPFAIYQIAISLNYFSSFPGEFDIKISYPGIEKSEFRIARFFSDKGNSYVSEGFCNEINHFEELKFDILSALIAAIPINIPGLSRGASMGRIVARTVIEAGKMYLGLQLIEFLGMTAVEILSGNPLDLFSSFIRRVARERLSYFAQIASEEGIEYAQMTIEMLINSMVRYVFGFTGLYGFAISFGINFAIAVADNVYNLIRGFSDVTYNCLRSGVKVQYVYMEFKKVYYSQNLYTQLDLEKIERDGKILANLTEGWLYKVSMTEETDKKIYVLSEVEIHKSSDRIQVKPNYTEIIKQ